jgi:hypothetical protein
MSKAKRAPKAPKCIYVASVILHRGGVPTEHSRVVVDKLRVLGCGARRLRLGESCSYLGWRTTVPRADEGRTWGRTRRAALDALAARMVASADVALASAIAHLATARAALGLIEDAQRSNRVKP